MLAFDWAGRLTPISTTGPAPIPIYTFDSVHRFGDYEDTFGANLKETALKAPL